VIDIGDDRLVAVEVKTQNSGFQKLDKYAEILGIDSEEKLDFVQWHEVTEVLSTVEHNDSLERELVEDFDQLIRYNSPSRRVKTNVYDSDTGDANIFEIERGPKMHVMSPYAEDNPPFALRIDVTRDSIEDIYISPREWEQLVDDMSPEVFKAFRNADFNRFDEFNDEERTVHARAGEHPEPRKVIQTSWTKDDVFVVGFRRRSARASFQGGQNGYPMMATREFEEFFGEQLTDEERRRLFEDQDLSVFLEDL